MGNLYEIACFEYDIFLGKQNGRFNLADMKLKLKKYLINKKSKY